MIHNKLKIGWYCPYTYIPLIENKHIEPIRISWESSRDGNFGCIKICKKMTSILETVFAESLDGLIMVDCCELAYSIYNHITNTYRDFPVYYMKVPSKYGEDFDFELHKGWNEISTILKIRDVRSEISKTDSPLGKKEVFKKNSRWCILPESIKSRLGTVNRFEAISILRDNVFCPRMHCEDKKNDPRHLCNNTGLYSVIEDSECLAQNYWVMYTNELV